MGKMRGIVIYNAAEEWSEGAYDYIEKEKYHVLKVPFEARFEYCTEGVTLPPQWLMENPVIVNQKENLQSEIPNDADVVLLLTDQSPYIETYNSFRAINKEHRFHLHVMMICNFNHRSEVDEGLLRTLPYYFEADSVCLINVNALLENQSNLYWSEYGTMYAMTFDENIHAVWRIAAEQMIDILNSRDFSKMHSDEDHIWVYDSNLAAYALRTVNKLVALNAVRDKRCLYEVVTTENNPRTLCIKLKKMRYRFAQAHHYGYSEKKCRYSGPCVGTCHYCESQALALYLRAQKRMVQEYDDERGHEVTAKISGIMRFRQDIDGPGLRSLVCFDECALSCKYCLNKETIHLLPCHMTTSVSQLGYALQKDFIYYDVSGGGVTFGGGEPLLNTLFIESFHKQYPKVDIILETSLNVELWRLDGLIDIVSRWIVDIKDMNPGIYQVYTGQGNERVIKNLQFLAAQGVSDRVVCRVPHIEGFNTDKDVDYSKKALLELGFSNIDVFRYEVL